MGRSTRGTMGVANSMRGRIIEEEVRRGKSTSRNMKTMTRKKVNLRRSMMSRTHSRKATKVLTNKTDTYKNLRLRRTLSTKRRGRSRKEEGLSRS